MSSHGRSLITITSAALLLVPALLHLVQKHLGQVSEAGGISRVFRANGFFMKMEHLPVQFFRFPVLALIPEHLRQIVQVEDIAGVVFAHCLLEAP